MKKLIFKSDSSLFSAISCAISDVKIKKQYRACPLCKRMTSEEVKGLWKCLKCSKIVDTVPTFVISLLLSDASGSFQTEAYGDKATKLLGIEATNLFEMNA